MVIFDIPIVLSGCDESFTHIVCLSWLCDLLKTLYVIRINSGLSRFGEEPEKEVCLFTKNIGEFKLISFIYLPLKIRPAHLEYPI